MKNRTTLFLMELLVMVLVFALAGAACVRGFVRADAISRETALRDQAAVFCRTGAETLKACRGISAGAEELGAVRRGDRWILIRETEEGSLHMEITARQTPAAGMGQADVAVYAGDGEEALFCLTVGWQEDLP